MFCAFKNLSLFEYCFGIQKLQYNFLVLKCINIVPNFWKKAWIWSIKNALYTLLWFSYCICNNT